MFQPKLNVLNCATNHWNWVFQTWLKRQNSPSSQLRTYFSIHARLSAMDLSFQSLEQKLLQAWHCGKQFWQHLSVYLILNIDRMICWIYSGVCLLLVVFFQSSIIYATRYFLNMLVYCTTVFKAGRTFFCVKSLLHRRQYIFWSLAYNLFSPQ